VFKIGDIIDDQYKVEGTCSNLGGMGACLFVRPVTNPAGPNLVLKYCRQSDEILIKRFKREVRLLEEFQGNSKIVQLLGDNLDYDPPYFVMKYYKTGDLTQVSSRIKSDVSYQEMIFLQAIDCITELHNRGKFHRDIKPQNFLLEGDALVVSDLGLSMESESKTAFTRSSEWWGTHGYMPPEFYKDGGFKNADPSGDIFMLGKTFYALVTGRDPLYIDSVDVPVPLFSVIERCCTNEKNRRYQNLASLKQALNAAYDILLGRMDGYGKARSILISIQEQLDQERKYNSKIAKEFISALAVLQPADQIKLCREIEPVFFRVLCQQTMSTHRSTFQAGARLSKLEPGYMNSL